MHSLRRAVFLRRRNRKLLVQGLAARPRASRRGKLLLPGLPENNHFPARIRTLMLVLLRRSAGFPHLGLNLDGFLGLVPALNLQGDRDDVTRPERLFEID